MITRRGVLGVLAALVPAFAAGRVKAEERKEDGLRKLPDGAYSWDPYSRTAPANAVECDPCKYVVRCDGKDVRRVTWCDTINGVLEHVETDQNGEVMVVYSHKVSSRRKKVVPQMPRDAANFCSHVFESRDARVSRLKKRGRIEVFQKVQ